MSLTEFRALPDITGSRCTPWQSSACSQERCCLDCSMPPGPDSCPCIQLCSDDTGRPMEHIQALLPPWHTGGHGYSGFRQHQGNTPCPCTRVRPGNFQAHQRVCPERLHTALLTVGRWNRFNQSDSIYALTKLNQFDIKSMKLGFLLILTEKWAHL